MTAHTKIIAPLLNERITTTILFFDMIVRAVYLFFGEQVHILWEGHTGKLQDLQVPGYKDKTD